MRKTDEHIPINPSGTGRSGRHYWLPRIFALLTAALTLVAGALTYAAERGEDPRPGPTPAIPDTSPPVPASVHLGQCGEWSFRFILDPIIYVDESFPIKLAWRPARRGANSVCKFAVALTFVTKSKVNTSPSTKLSGFTLGATEIPSDFGWTAQVSSPGPVTVTALLTGNDLPTPVAVSANIDARPSRRISDADKWLADLVDGLGFEVVSTGVLTKGRRASLTGRLTSSMRPAPPGLSATGEAEVCLEATGGGKSERTCSLHRIMFSKPLSLERSLTVDVTNTDAVVVTATVKIKGSVDGTLVGGYGSNRTKKVGKNPTVAFWDVTKNAAVASKELLLTIAALLAALGTVGFVLRRRRKKDDDSPAGGDDNASRIGYV
ncbi:hypothetical protein AB0C29_07175 [Actinoplanes sp. NPDC048791]|uniref:hypothetical protein n=1 Tax=Actinoplanes sp. NPDC048791 TaxID=3154623 RepID=UPI0033CD6C62